MQYCYQDIFQDWLKRMDAVQADNKQNDNMEDKYIKIKTCHKLVISQISSYSITVCMTHSCPVKSTHLNAAG